MIRYYITDRKALGNTEQERTAQMIAALRHACANGVDWICLREKDLPTRDLERLALLAMKVVQQEGRSKLLVHSRADVALAAGADGVHLPSGEQTIVPSEVRAIWQTATIGVSCHNLDEVSFAEAHGADFAVFSPIFEKDGVRLTDGLKHLRAVCQTRTMPVLALGGVTLENAASCMAAGAAGIAGIRLFQDQNKGTG